MRTTSVGILLLKGNGFSRCLGGAELCECFDGVRFKFHFFKKLIFFIFIFFAGSPCAHLPDGTYALFECSQHFLSCFSNKALLRSCAKGLFYDERKQQCNNKENVKACTEHTQTSHAEGKYCLNWLRLFTFCAFSGCAPMRETFAGEVKMAMSDTVHEVPSLLPNLACSVDGSVSLGCSPYFIMCAGGIAYMFHCDSGLVFDQVTFFLVELLTNWDWIWSSVYKCLAGYEFMQYSENHFRMCEAFYSNGFTGERATKFYNFSISIR